MKKKKLSGKVDIEMPRALHAKLHLQAEEQGVSFQEWVTYLIAMGLANRHVDRPKNPCRMTVA